MGGLADVKTGQTKEHLMVFWHSLPSTSLLEVPLAHKQTELLLGHFLILGAQLRV